MKYVIIGNGAAGIHAAEAIRQLDTEGSITMIGDENFDPYCRPMISMVLEGSLQPDQLPIRSANFYKDLKIEPVLGKRVTGIDVENKKVLIQEKKRAEGSGTLMDLLCKLLSIISSDPVIEDEKISQKAFEFDKLLIATGADPRPVKAEGLNLKNIFYMRTENHVRQIVKTLPDAKKALVLGGGLVGFKAAHGLLQQGIHVTLLIRSGYPLSMQVDEAAGKLIRDELLAHGLEVKVGVEVRAFQGQGKVERAILSDGTELPCDAAVIGKGVLPALSFVPRDKIQIDLGILVNPQMETSIPGIFAAGDVAETIDIARKTPWVNAIWPEAVDQGRIAGMNMAGRSVAYRGSLSRNVIRIFGLDVMSGGIVNPPSDDPQYEILDFTHPRLKIYRKLVFRNNTLVGMVMVNAVEQGGVFISLIQNQTPVTIPKAAMLEPSFNCALVMGL
jgi:NAD(P)H-nitrite reductase large subunit